MTTSDSDQILDAVRDRYATAARAALPSAGPARMPEPLGCRGRPLGRKASGGSPRSLTPAAGRDFLATSALHSRS